MDTAFTSDEIRFWKRIGIRLLRFFGVTCTFIGYLVVIETLRFGVFDSQLTQIGLGLFALGVPHILASNRLQANAEIADPELASSMQPPIPWLVGTSLLLPGLVFIFFLLEEPGASREMVGFALVPVLIWFAGIVVVGTVSPGATRPALYFGCSTAFFILMFVGCAGTPPRGVAICVATISVWLAGLVNMILQRGGDLTPWDRTYIRWGWLILLALGITIADLVLR